MTTKPLLLSQYVHEKIQSICSRANENDELEFRIGTKSHHQFQANCKVVDFYKAQQHKLLSNTAFVTERTTVTYYQQANNETFIREIYDEDTKETLYQKKIKKQSYDIGFDKVAVRLSLQQELNCEDITDEKLAQMAIVKTRKRHRKIYEFSNWSLHLTEVENSNEQNQNLIDKTYEIEGEIKNQNNVNEAICALTELFTIVYPDKVSYMEDQYRFHIFEQFNDLLTFHKLQTNEGNINKTVAMIYESRPKNLKPHHLMNSRLFALTNKLDGTNYYLYINVLHEQNQKFIVFYLVNRNECFLIYRVSAKQSPQLYSQLQLFDQTICQGELVESSFNIFDCLIASNTNMSDEDHCTRCKSIRPLVETIQQKYATSWLKIKHFVFDSQMNLKTSIVGILRRMHIDYGHNIDKYNDGLMFIPVREPYKNEFTYKYKFPTKMTIDFQLKNKKVVSDEQGTFDEFELHVCNNANMLEQFSAVDKDTINKHIKSTPATLRMKQNKDQDQDPSNSLICLQNDSIIECTFNTNNRKFEYYRSREDKIKPNYISVALDVYNDIINPVQMEDILIAAEENGLKNSLDQMRKFHNLCKRELIESYCNDKSILDIGFGHGGDYKKYLLSNVRKVTGLEPDYENLKKSLTRLNSKQVTHNERSKFTIKHVSGDSQEDLALILENEKFDVVSSFFSLTFFYENCEKLTRLVDNINLYLKTGGCFIGTFMDGNSTRKFLQKHNNNAQVQNYYAMQYIGHDKELIENTYGQKIMINIGENSIVQNQIEYVAYFDLLKNMLHKNNIILKESSFLHSQEGNEEMKEFSNLYRKFVFVKESLVSINYQHKHVDSKQLKDENNMNTNNFANDNTIQSQTGQIQPQPTVNFCQPKLFYTKTSSIGTLSEIKQIWKQLNTNLDAINKSNTEILEQIDSQVILKYLELLRKQISTKHANSILKVCQHDVSNRLLHARFKPNFVSKLLAISKADKSEPVDAYISSRMKTLTETFTDLTLVSETKLIKRIFIEPESGTATNLFKDIETRLDEEIGANYTIETIFKQPEIVLFKQSAIKSLWVTGQEQV